MKIFLLAILVLLFIQRIKKIPEMLSKKKYIDKINKALDDLSKKKKSEIPEEALQMTKGVTIGLCWLIVIILSLFYIGVGVYINIPLIMVLSAIEVVFTILFTKDSASEINTILDGEGRNIKFRRYTFLVNIILDYVYYTLAIYYLIQMF